MAGNPKFETALKPANATIDNNIEALPKREPTIGGIGAIKVEVLARAVIQADGDSSSDAQEQDASLEEEALMSQRSHFLQFSPPSVTAAFVSIHCLLILLFVVYHKHQFAWIAIAEALSFLDPNRRFHVVPVLFSPSPSSIR
ncbi:Hypothetical predicted protein [Olea europaea subsp. europaea]|uniref:Uncharacterized protein n=1 Tax=Olea europaea subsp. europaea TaxID=158383 RepID=A0A8S0UUD3_OLEEU|nr:Hypothetical predicted protein [Olea europaea subsp. europaea]